jgi:hypothetical protein
MPIQPRLHRPAHVLPAPSCQAEEQDLDFEGSMTLARPTLAALAILLVVPGCDLFDPNGGGGPSPSDPTTDLARVALQAHDQVRASAKPTPSPALPTTQWSAEVEAVAAQWAAHCVYEHNAGRGNLGENIAASSPGYWSSIIGVVQAWASEAADYDYASNSCAAGKVCGHYTQLVWRDSTLIGCAYARCTRNSPFQGVDTWDFWVCDYSPPGNWVGQRPY